MSRAQLTSTVEQNTGGAVAPFVAGKNFLANGGFDIWQRGTSVAIANGNAYGADRWNDYFSVASITTSRQSTNDTTNLPNIQYCSRVQRNSGTTTTGTIWHTQSIESAQSIPLVGKTVTLSFYARAGANFSSSSNALTAAITSGTGTDQNLLNGFTGSATTASSTVTLTTNWQRFTVTGTVSSSATQVGVYFTYSATGTANTNDYYEVTGVQLELGSVATSFSRAGGTLQGELALCQRYYAQTYAGDSITMANYTTANAYGTWRYPVPMRAAPAILFTSASNTTYFSNNSPQTPSALSYGNIAIASMELEITGSFTQGYSGFVRLNNAGVIQASAEL